VCNVLCKCIVLSVLSLKMENYKNNKNTKKKVCIVFDTNTAIFKLFVMSLKYYKLIFFVFLAHLASIRRPSVSDKKIFKI
jgi:hypothetical protein